MTANCGTVSFACNTTSFACSTIPFASVRVRTCRHDWQHRVLCPKGEEVKRSGLCDLPKVPDRLDPAAACNQPSNLYHKSVTGCKMLQVERNICSSQSIVDLVE